MRLTKALRTTASIGASALWLGCVSVTPDLAVPTAPSETWTAVTESAPDTAAPGVDWWTHFGDETLTALVEEALAANHDLHAAAHRVDAAAARARIAGAASEPSASVGASGSRRRQNFIGLPIPGAESGVLSSTSTTYGVSLDAAWEIDLWGRLRATSEAATAEVAASRADYRAARLSLAAQTARSWLALVEATQQVELAERILEGRRLTREKIQRRFNLGIRDALDLRLALANEASAAAELAVRQRLLDATARQLEVLLTRYPQAALAAALDLPELPNSIDAGLPSEILLRRPDLEAAGLRLSAAGFNLDAARAALYPRLTLTGSLGRSTDDAADILDQDFSVWSLAAGLLQPVFQGGRLRANVELTEANQRAALEGYRQTILRSFAEVETALASERFLRGEREAQEKAMANAVASAQLAERRYESGLSDYLAVLTAQVTSQRAQSQLLTVRRQQLDARVNLVVAIGGGWEERAELVDSAEPPVATPEPPSSTHEATR